MPKAPTRMIRLAKAINDKIEQSVQQQWKVGHVTVVSPLTVTVDGGSVVLPKLASYTPTVGDTVQIAWPKNRPFVLGKIG